MANTFKNAGIAVGTTRSNLYVCPPATQAVIHALYISNVDGVNPANVSVEITVDGGTTYRHIVKTMEVPPDNTIIMDKPINLEANDVLALTASVVGDIEAVAAVLEIS